MNRPIVRDFSGVLTRVHPLGSANVAPAAAIGGAPFIFGAGPWPIAPDPQIATASTTQPAVVRTHLLLLVPTVL